MRPDGGKMTRKGRDGRERRRYRRLECFCYCLFSMPPRASLMPLIPSPKSGITTFPGAQSISLQRCHGCFSPVHHHLHSHMASYDTSHYSSRAPLVSCKLSLSNFTSSLVATALFYCILYVGPACCCAATLLLDGDGRTRRRSADAGRFGRHLFQVSWTWQRLCSH